MLMRRAPGNRYASLVKQWMHDWRDLPGVQMWGVTNYLLSVSVNDALSAPRDRLLEQFESSRDCLQTLAFDHTARYVACLYCEAALRLGKYAEFAEGVERYRTLLEDDNAEYWMYQRRKHLPKTLLLFKTLYETNNPKEAWAISRKLKQNLSDRFSWLASLSWIAPLWWRQTRDKLSLPRRVWMYCRLLLI